MFTGFSQQTGEFLWGIAFHNERGWFLEHKEEFERVLNRPFKTLAGDTLRQMKERFPDGDWQAHVSRIYRDARRLYGRGPYKDHMWFSLHSGDRRQGGPSFWFEISGGSYSYGMGQWDVPAAQAQRFRAAIDAAPQRFAALVRELGDDYQLWGEAYKRPKADRGELLNPWFNRKQVSVGWEKPFGGDLFSPDLPAVLADGYARLMPLFDFFRQVWQAHRAAELAEERASAYGFEL